MTAVKRPAPAAAAAAAARRHRKGAGDAHLRAKVEDALLVHRTLLWWALLSAISVFNVAIWVHSYRSLSSGGGASSNDHPHQRRHLALSGIYVFACAYRSFLPRIDLERLCLWDTFASSIFLGRTAATVAELAFSCQVALFLHRLGEVHDHRTATCAAHLLVPAIFVAQCFCWRGVVSLNHGYHAVEESIWAAASVLVGAVLLSLAVQHPQNRPLRILGAGGALLSFAFCGFMVVVDVPMYVRRWREGRRKGGGVSHRTSFEGWKDALRRRVVTKSWDVWREETVWLTGYFSSAVWLSLLLVHYPAPM